MSYKLVIFDADDTLFDFARSEIAAFHKTLKPFLADHNPEQVFKTYRNISQRLWAKLEKSHITKDVLKVERFKRLSKRYKLKLDYEKISEDYLSNLSLEAHLIDGAEELCREISAYARVGIMTNGIVHVQKSRLALSPIAPYVHFMVVSEECGFAKPDPRIFKYTLEKALHEDLSTVLMVGDRLDADIVGAQRFGIKSCWFNPKKSRGRPEIVPDYEIHSLKDLLDILKKKTS